MIDDNDSTLYVIGHKVTTTLFDKSVCTVLQQLPLPGVVIFVHGVNSDGEWYDQAEEGLCRGLNARLARTDDQLCYTGIEAGQMVKTNYHSELTSTGFLDRRRDASTFITPDPHFSPVIRFRYGYKANDTDLKEFGANIWLNEDNYWGGGPFANGCSALPDLWSAGLNSRLFLWITAQHLNPTSNRDVYTCPPRAYYVHAAWRLAKLIELIRQKQADVPVTIACHSQGNMVAMAAAFLGQQWPEVTDRRGKRSKAVADTYVLCNPPYSLQVDDMGTDNWAQRGLVNAAGQSGRQTGAARIATLRHFLDILAQRAALEQPHTDIDWRGANAAPKNGSPGYTAAADTRDYGCGQATKGRVTLYCNPADQVIAATTVQGIGWLGVSDTQMKQLGYPAHFTQRIWAQGYPVGKAPPPRQPIPGAPDQSCYHYWHHHWRQPRPGSPDFWWPHSPPARFRLAKGIEAGDNVLAKLTTVASAPVLLLLTALIKIPIQALPPDDWKIRITAPKLPEAFLPTARQFGKEGGAGSFDQGSEATAAQRDKSKAQSNADDPYDAYAGNEGEAPQGDAQSEALLRYEDRARLRMMARREGKADEQQRVAGEDNAAPGQAWEAWRKEKIIGFLKDSVNENATDHSTILTNASNAEKALAYDVAVGYSLLSPADWRELRVAADWRLVGELENTHSHFIYREYNEKGTLEGKPLHEHRDYVPDAMPKTIVDERQNKPVRSPLNEAYYA